MPPIRITVDTSNHEKTIAVLLKRADVALARALNRTAASAMTAVARAIAADLGLPVSVVKQALLIQKATSTNLVATFRASAKRVPLIDFGARGPEPSRGKGGGVTAKLPGGAGRYPQAFIATVGAGRHRGVFQRKPGSKRLPIYELRGPSIWQSFENNRQVAIASADEQLPKNVAHELQFELLKTV